MLLAIDNAIRALAQLSKCDESRVVELLEETGDAWECLSVFLGMRELKELLDAQARVMYPNRRIMYGDTATHLRVMMGLT